MDHPVNFDDLLNAFEWVSAGAQYDNTAYIHRVTGKVFFDSDEFEPEEPLPEDYEDGTLYIAAPHKNELNLGRNLVFDFVEENMPESLGVVQDFFRKKGAYSRYKDLLERKGRLDDWHRFEAAAVEAALRDWAAENKLDISPSQRPPKSPH